MTKVLVLLVIFATLLAVGCTGSADEETSSHAEESSVQESPTPEPTPEPMPVQEYQELEWMASVQKYSAIIGTDFDAIGNAADDSDLTSMGIYAQYLVDDTQDAIKENDKYTVSPSFEDAQKEWRLGLQNYNSAGQFAVLGANELDNGDYDRGVEYIDKFATFSNTGSFHLERATASLDIV